MNCCSFVKVLHVLGCEHISWVFISLFLLLYRNNLGWLVICYLVVSVHSFLLASTCKFEVLGHVAADFVDLVEVSLDRLYSKSADVFHSNLLLTPIDSVCMSLDSRQFDEHSLDFPSILVHDADDLVLHETDVAIAILPNAGANEDYLRDWPLERCDCRHERSPICHLADANITHSSAQNCTCNPNLCSLNHYPN